MSQLSIIIVSWNAQNYLRGCLASIRAHRGDVVKEVVVVDNASSDGSAEMVARDFPEVKLVRSTANLGFARANNLGISQTTGPLLALVNSDVLIHEGCFQRLASYMDGHPEVGLAGPKVFGGDGLIQLTCGRLPTLWNTACRFLAIDRVLSRWPAFSGFQMRHWTYETQGEVEVLSGCFWLARRSAVEKVGGLDERFFFYAEDWDWCKRFRDAGWKVMFVPEATATHFGGGSSANAPLRYSIEMLRGSLTYWQKHHGTFGRSACYSMAMVRHFLRLIAHGLLRAAGVVKTDETRRKVREDWVCLRWLLTGKSV